MNGKTINLRALEMEDLDFLYEVENDKSLWGVGCTNVPYSRQVLIDYITNSSADIYADKQVRFVIEDEQSQAIGIVDLVNFDPRHLRAELGVMIKREERGKGHAQEAIRQVLAYSRQILHLHQVYAVTSVRNEKAAKMLLGTGFESGKILKDWLFDGEKYENAYLFQRFL